MRKFLPAFVIALLVGCQTGTNQPDIARIALAVREAASIGTAEALHDHPEWRPQFVVARDNLNALAARDKITVADLLAGLDALPVSELNSDTARLIIAGAKITVALAGWSDVEIVQTEQLKPVVLALAQGIDSALPLEAAKARARAVTPHKHYKAKK